jgi:hypothetical protein
MANAYSRLACLVDVEAAAAWRERTAAEYPDDPRNLRAAEILFRLAPEVAALNGSPLHCRIETFIPDNCEEVTLVVTEKLRRIGFSYWPSNAEQFLSDIVRDLQQQHQCKAGGYLRAV